MDQRYPLPLRLLLQGRRLSTSHMRARVDSDASSTHPTDMRGAQRNVQEQSSRIPPQNALNRGSQQATTTDSQGQGLKASNAYNQDPPRMATAEPQTQDTGISATKPRRHRIQDSIDSNTGPAYFTLHGQQASTDSVPQESVKEPKGSKKNASRGLDGAAEARAANARANDTAFMEAFNADLNKSAVTGGVLVQKRIFWTAQAAQRTTRRP